MFPVATEKSIKSDLECEALRKELTKDSDDRRDDRVTNARLP